MDPSTLTPEALAEYVAMGLPIATSALLGLLILIVGWIASKWAQRLVLNAAKRGKLQEELARFLGNIVRYIVIAATVIAALERVGVQTTSLIAVFASAGLAVGLALQGSLQNFAAGVMILFFRPFSLGDRITAGGHTGVVTDIGLFATTYLAPNNDKIIIGNGDIMASSITNHTVMGNIRATVEVGVAYGESLQEAIEVCKKAAQGAEHVLPEPGVAVAFTNFGASSLDLAIHCWCVADNRLAMLHNVRVAVYDALNDAGIEIPFNQIVVHQAEAEAEAAAAK